MVKNGKRKQQSEGMEDGRGFNRSIILIYKTRTIKGRRFPQNAKWEGFQVGASKLSQKFLRFVPTQILGIVRGNFLNSGQVPLSKREVRDPSFEPPEIELGRGELFP